MRTRSIWVVLPLLTACFENLPAPILPEQGETGDDATMECHDVELALIPVIPTVVLLVDQSFSMGETFSGTSRWNALRSALIDPVDGVVTALETEVRFGLALFTSYMGDAGGECPLLVEVAPSLTNFDAISDIYRRATPLHETPTGDSIVAVTAELKADTYPGPKFMVLATDGDSDTCELPNPNEGQGESVAAMQAAFAEGIPTFVISVGDDLSPENLRALANAGAGVGPTDPDAPYYVPSDAEAMIETFRTIVHGIRPCVYGLDQPIMMDQEMTGTLSIDGEPLPYDETNGWRINGPTEIEFLGDACQRVQAGGAELSIEFTCDAMTPT